MADFTDTFNRANASDLGNNWKYRHRHDGSTPVPWRVVSNIARPPTDTGLNVIAYRSGLQAPNNTFQVHFFVANPIGSNNAEMSFRYNGVLGAGNTRLSVVIIDGTGYLRQRFWPSGDASETSVDLGSWARTGNNIFDITIDVTDANLITVYDSGFTGPDHKALELTSSLYAVNTGIAMVSGWFDQVIFDDIGQGTSADFDVDDITARVTTDLRLDGATPASGAFPDAVQRLAGHSVSDYTVIDGIPTRATSIARSSASLNSTITQVDDGLRPSPHAITIGSTYRWLADTGFGGGNWNPLSGGLSIYLSSLLDPVQKLTYRYPSAAGTLVRPAICFKGAAFGRLTGFSGAPANTDFTVAITAVLKSAPAGKDYGVMITDATDEADPGLGTPLGVLYRSGLLQVDAGKRVLARESWKTVGRPTTIILSIGADTGAVWRRFDGGRLLIQDAKRTSHQFSTRGMSRSGRLFFGAHMNLLDQFAANTAGELDILEINYWTRALHHGEMLEVNNLLSACYGVT